MENISSNSVNYMCVNGSNPQNDRNKSDDKILYFLPCRRYVLWIGIALIIIGVLSLVFIYFMKKPSNQQKSFELSELPSKLTYKLPSKLPEQSGKGKKKSYKKK